MTSIEHVRDMENKDDASSVVRARHCWSGGRGFDPRSLLVVSVSV